VQLLKREQKISDMEARFTELLACGMPTGGGSGQSGPRVTASPVTVTSLANYVGGSAGSANGGGASSLSLDLPAATDLSSFNTGKLTGLGLTNLEEKLGSLFSSPSLGSGYSKVNGNSNMD
jgi:hypothetical protein